jgi:putative hydrolase of the HAD superfamily
MTGFTKTDKTARRPGTLATQLALHAIFPTSSTGNTRQAASIAAMYDYINLHGVERHCLVTQAKLPDSSYYKSRLLPHAKLPLVPKLVLFDVYGTLLGSALGEVSAKLESSGSLVSSRAGQDEVMENATCSEGFREILRQLIVRDHAVAKASGRPFPEVDIIDIFQRALDLPMDPEQRLAAAVACVECECRWNPCAVMPGAAAFMRLCRDSGVKMGIISNAQFYTPLFLEAAFEESILDNFLLPELLQWSWLCGRAKPDTWMFEVLMRAIEHHGINRHEVLYIGNDALNDCAAAAEAGFMTCLFAGDARSLKLRRRDARVSRNPPQVIAPSWLDAAAIFA